MSSAKQIIALIKTHTDGDEDAFFSIALQVAAAEARQGRRRSAEELRDVIDKARRQNQSTSPSVAIPFARPRGDLEGLIDMHQPQLLLKDVILKEENASQLNDVIRQQRKRDWLREHGKVPNRRVLFVGPPGSGKTMTAQALAGELKLPLFVIRLEYLITRFMGATAAKLRLIFDETAKKRGVYLFDEFDAVGSDRLATNDVAEMRRVLNSFLQFMEESNSTDSLIICATNHPSLLDQALLRRYDLVLKFEEPNEKQIQALIKSNLHPFKHSRLAWKRITEQAKGLSQSEIVNAISDAVKTSILDEKNTVTSDSIIRRLEERQQMRTSFLDKNII